MTNAKLTKRNVDAATAIDRDTYLWDRDLSGFGLKITPAGRKVYLIQYRLGGRNGRTRRFTIGRHGQVTADQARARAKMLLGDVSAGRDPAAERDRASADRSMGAVIEQFLAEHVDTKLKASTQKEYRRLANLHILPAFRHRQLADISRSDISRFHHSLRDMPYQANRLLAFLSKFFNWAEKHDLRPDSSNPCRHLEKYKERERERFLSEDELARLGTALQSAELEETISPWVGAAVRLLILTGARLDEILTLEWRFVDLEGQQLRLPDSKSDEKSIYLNPPAIDVLSGVPRLEGNPYVICGRKAGAHLVNLQKAWQRIRKSAGLDDVRLHDLRHSFASIAARKGMSLLVIGELLGHSQPQTTQRYAHLGADPIKAASSEVGESISAALGLQQPATPES